MRRPVATFLDGLVSHAVLDGGRLVVAHAGMLERYQGRAPRASARSPCSATRRARRTSSACRSAWHWAADYRGRATVVYGHTPVAEPAWVNNTINIDTGCVFGGA